MNRQEVIRKVSQLSEVNIDNCDKVLNALEKVLSDELGSSKGKQNAFDKVFKLMDFLRKK